MQRGTFDSAVSLGMINVRHETTRSQLRQLINDSLEGFISNKLSKLSGTLALVSLNFARELS